MKHLNCTSIAAAAVFVCALCLTPRAHADLDFAEGSWRVELSTSFGVHSGTKDRSGNTLITGTVEYEVPATPRTTIGLRLMPLFLYTQDERSSRHYFFDHGEEGDDEDDTVWGGGFGLTGRLYQVKNEYRGWYGEVEALAVLHSNEIRGNSANLNFLTGIGVGYKFKNNWHAILKYEHISNAGLSDRNSGANGVGFGFGYSF